MNLHILNFHFWKELIPLKDNQTEKFFQIQFSIPYLLLLEFILKQYSLNIQIKNIPSTSILDFN